MEKTNYIIAVIYIEEDDIQKNIRIINSQNNVKENLNGKIFKMNLKIKMKKK